MIRTIVVATAAIGLAGCGTTKRPPPSVQIKTEYVHLSPNDALYDACPQTYKDEVPPSTASVKDTLSFYKEKIEKRYRLCYNTVQALKSFDSKAKETVKNLNSK